MADTPAQPPRQPSLGLALVPIAITLLVLGVQLFYFGDFTPHIPLAIGLAVTGMVGYALGHSWSSIERGVFHVIHVSLPSVSVLITVGMIIGVWIASGTVPTLIYYGLLGLSPEIFLAAAMILCSVVSVSLGTSWGTVGTVGLALMGIGAGFGIPVYWTAGAVVSGAFFGDKISPLSDTTNLAPAVTGTSLFDHIRNMLPTTIPAMAIALGIYTWAGFSLIEGDQASFERIEAITAALEEGGTLMSPLIPWNAGGAFVISALALGIGDGNFENLLYIPLAFACWLAPVIGIIYAFTGLFSPRATAGEIAAWQASGEAIKDLSHHGFQATSHGDVGAAPALAK
ncbi:MAG: Na+/H+ antiporter NhaC family protein [Candidatus Competibacterales bacterium]